MSQAVVERPPVPIASPRELAPYAVFAGILLLLLMRILQGVEDPDVPWQHAVELVSRLASDDVVLTLVKDGDHRLSRPEDIERMIRAVAEF